MNIVYWLNWFADKAEVWLQSIQPWQRDLVSIAVGLLVILSFQYIKWFNNYRKKL